MAERLPDGTGLSPCGSSQQAVSPVPASIPDAVIEDFCEEVKKPLEAIVHGFCDEAYGAIMESVQDYLRENAVFNINSAFETQHRAYLDALYALRAVEASATLFEAQSNARAIRKGTWSLARSEEFRAEAQAIEARRAATLGAVHESAVAASDAPTPDILPNQPREEE